MPREEELPILRAFYDFAVCLIPKIAKFPRDHRFVLRERIERQLYAVGPLLCAAWDQRWASYGAGAEDEEPGDE